MKLQKSQSSWDDDWWIRDRVGSDILRLALNPPYKLLGWTKCQLRPTFVAHGASGKLLVGVLGARHVRMFDASFSSPFSSLSSPTTASDDDDDDDDATRLLAAPRRRDAGARHGRTPLAEAPPLQVAGPRARRGRERRRFCRASGSGLVQPR